MFTAADDAAVGIPVVTGAYPEGEEGIQKSLAVICKKIYEGAATAVMKSYAANLMKQSGFPEGARAQGEAALEHVRANVMYAPDALGTEQIQRADVTLCVEGAPVCIPCGDCFPEGTLLLRRDGQLVPIEEIKVGDEIWGDKKWSRIEGKAFKGKLKVDAIEMNNGSTMYLTPDHKVYVGRCKHGKSVDCPTCGARPSLLTESWDRIRVGDLQNGESLLQPKRIAFADGPGAATTCQGTNERLDRLYIDGLAISEGWVDGARFCISGQDGKRKEILKHEVKAICDRLGVPTSTHRKYIRINDAEWATRVASFGHLARNKHFETLALDEAEAAAVLRGIMSDSTANTRGEGRTYATTSHALMVQVRVLHRMFGRSTSLKMLTPEQHRGAGKHPLWRVGIRVKSDEHELARNDKTLATRSIERAVKKVPCWDIQTDDHKVYLPEHDVTVSNCDDLVCALATILAALGLEVVVVRQQFGGGHQQHVIVEVKDEYGHWYPLDPSSKTMPAGVKSPAQNETRHSPFDGAEEGARFVGIGALPVLIWKKEKWHPVGVGTPLEKAAEPCCNACAIGNPCDGDKTEVAMTTRTERPMYANRGGFGFGAPWPGVTAFVAQWAWLNQAWATLDANGRSWSDTLSSAYARAEARNWTAGDATSRSDLLALILASAFSARAVASMPDQGQRAADDLNATWLVIARKIGYTPDMTVDQLKARVNRENNPAAAAAITASFELVIGVVAVAAWVIIYCFVIYFAYKILDSLLSRIVAFAELIYLQVQVQKIVDRHLADPNLPWTEAEKNELQKLEDMQRGAHGAIVAPPSSDKDEGTPAWVWIGGGIVLTGGVLAVVYRDEIKRYLNRGRSTGASEGRRRRRFA